ncbi:holocytochrome c synthase [Zygosaccharomyces mellis]|uniref:Holocytochrome c-type synthase n=1 Tax=Zygosaccharomyces mellis TaxID=42258 RepID=A0A4C2E4C0_9SACH|nr:holocytochrome c synthase [Zygosaccharomyces mellis]
MGWFWADPVVDHCSKAPSTLQASSSPSCPVMHRSSNVKPETSACPVMHHNSKPTENEPIGLNPLNNMPAFLSANKQQGQTLDLPTERTTSSIPKGDNTNEHWEYPSPQQMYNAMLRKGKIDPNTGEEIPEDAVESMVQVHNFLNEGCWQEVLEWEKPHSQETQLEPKLLKFTGKPGQLTPRARYYGILSKLFPNYFEGEPPFDRHDWLVLRADPMSADPENPGYRKIRYVIDFYGGADDEEGMPTFHLDVRPALDNITNAKDRFTRYYRELKEKYNKD